MKILDRISDQAKKITIIITLITTMAGTAWGAVSFVDSRYAHSEDLIQLQERVTKAELKDLLEKALDNMYHYRGLARKYPEDKEIAEKLKEAEEEVTYLKKRIRTIEEGERGVI